MRIIDKNEDTVKLFFMVLKKTLSCSEKKIVNKVNRARKFQIEMFI